VKRVLTFDTTLKEKSARVARRVLLAERSSSYEPRQLGRALWGSQGRAGHSCCFCCVASHNVVIGGVGLRVPSQRVPPTGHRCARLRRACEPVAAATVLGVRTPLPSHACAPVPPRQPHTLCSAVLTTSPIRHCARATPLRSPRAPRAPGFPTAQLEKSGAGEVTSNVSRRVQTFWVGGRLPRLLLVWRV